MTQGLFLLMFDCDGTIVDSQNVIVTAMAQAFVDHGFAAPDRPSILSGVGLSIAVALKNLLPNEADRTIESVAQSYRNACFALRTQGPSVEPLYADAADTIRRLSQRSNVLIGVATGKSQRGVARLIGENAFEGCFATIQTADDAPSKPHPAMLEQAMNETGAERSGTVMIGDTVFDMEMARAAGVQGIGVSWGYHDRSSLEGAGAEMIIDRFTQLDEALSIVLPGFAEGVLQ